MENIYKLSVPLIVDVKIGDNWGEVENNKKLRRGGRKI